MHVTVGLIVVVFPPLPDSLYKNNTNKNGKKNTQKSELCVFDNKVEMTEPPPWFTTKQESLMNNEAAATLKKP